MSFWDDITVGLGNAASAVGLGDVGLGPDFETSPIHLPGVPVQPSADMTDAELRAWRLQNSDKFAAGGLSVDLTGNLGLLTGYDPLSAPGAIVPSPSQEFSKSVVGQVSGIGGGIGDAISGLKTVAIGVGVLLGLILLIELVKK